MTKKMEETSTYHKLHCGCDVHICMIEYKYCIRVFIYEFMCL